MKDGSLEAGSLQKRGKVTGVHKQVLESGDDLKPFWLIALKAGSYVLAAPSGDLFKTKKDLNVTETRGLSLCFCLRQIRAKIPACAVCEGMCLPRMHLCSLPSPLSESHHVSYHSPPPTPRPPPTHLGSCSLAQAAGGTEAFVVLATVPSGIQLCEFNCREGKGNPQ